MWGAKKGKTVACFVVWYYNIYVKFLLIIFKIICISHIGTCGPIADSIATHYGLDGLGIEPIGGWDFVHPSRAALPDSYCMGTGVFPGLK
jgi:hypothetical protein